LFVHRCSDKFRFEKHTYSTKQCHPLPSFYSSLPLENECWGWMSELARLSRRKLANHETAKQPPPSPKTRPKQTRVQRPKARMARSPCNTPVIIQAWNAGSTIDLQTAAARLYRASPRSAMVIGTFAAVPYIHLQLEARRRFYPEVPLLVHDDGSHKGAALSALCRHYDCDFEHNERRQGALGDLTAFVGGLIWAAALNVDILLKVSRRWLFRANWEPSLETLAEQSQYATFSSYTTSCDYGFRTECMGMAVAVWAKKSAFLDDAMNQIIQDRKCLLEGYIHEFARKFEQQNCETAEHWRKAHPMAEVCNGYALWKLLGTDRSEPSPDFLWHDSCGPQAYGELALEWDLPYTLDDFNDPNQGHGSGL
jgi:hypothetical protein